MANLVSPGVQVTVTDESVYGPAGSGTVPMIFIATGQNKVDPTSTETDGIAKYTKSAQLFQNLIIRYCGKFSLESFLSRINCTKLSFEKHSEKLGFGSPLESGGKFHIMYLCHMFPIAM